VLADKAPYDEHVSSFNFKNIFENEVATLNSNNKIDFYFKASQK